MAFPIAIRMQWLVLNLPHSHYRSHAKACPGLGNATLETLCRALRASGIAHTHEAGNPCCVPLVLRTPEQCLPAYVLAARDDRIVRDEPMDTDSDMSISVANELTDVDMAT